MILNGTGEAIESAEYPLTTEELVEECGDHELELQAGTEAVADALERAGEETYESPEEARFALLSGLSEKAVGRQGYSDRDPVDPDSPYGPEQVSF
jgi:hypothetical protein